MTAPPKRHVRPELDRLAPIRTFNRAWGRSNARPGASAEPPSPPVHPAARGVELGYRVIEEYMREGQAFARRARPSDADGGAAAPTDPRRLTERLFQNASDFAAAWLEYAQTVMAQTPWASAAPMATQAPVAPPVGGFDVDEEPPRAASVAGEPAAVNGTGRPPERVSAQAPVAAAPAVTLDVVSRRRAEVTVELKPGAARGSLVAHDLRRSDPGQPRIEGVLLEADAVNDRVTVRLDVPEDRPPGVYTGLVVDQTTNLPRGSIAVRILDDARSGSP